MTSQQKNKGLFLAHLVGVLVMATNLASCGPTPSSQLKIIGGEKVDESDPIAQRVAALVDHKGAVKCTATAISPTVFVTAAHCVYGRSYEDWSIQSGTSVGSGEILPIAEAITHPDFAAAMLRSLTPSDAPNDLAIIRTHDASKGTIPVPIIRKGMIEQIAAPSEITVAGFGRTVGSDPDSKGTLQKANVFIESFHHDVREFTTVDQNGKMGCHGDSGGPAFYLFGKTLTLIGTVSRGDNSCLSGKTVFTDASEFEDFLLSFAPEINLDI